MITKSYFKLVKVSYADSDYFRVTNVDATAGTLTINAGNNLGCNIEYSTDGVNWTTADKYVPFSLIVPAGANVYMRGNNGLGMRYKTINMDVNHTVGGNVYSLLDKATYASRTTSVADYEFQELFKNDTHLVNAIELTFGNVTTINQVAYTQMFMGCSSLTKGPELPATNLPSACFQEMFRGCSNFTSVKIGVTTWNTSNTSNWLKDVAASGTIYAPTGSDIANYSGASGVPSGWTVVYY